MTRQLPTKHGDTHRPPGTNGPDDPGGSDWINGLGAVNAAVMLGSIQALIGSVPNQNIILPYPVDPAFQTYGEIQTPIVVERYTYPAGAIIQLSNPAVIHIDTTVAPYSLTADVYVWNGDASEGIHLQGSAVANSGVQNDSCSVSHASLSVISTTGSDLSYSTSFGRISSAAGGIYTAQLVLTGSW